MPVKKSFPYSGYILSLLRVVIGLLFTCHGAQKLLGMFGGVGGHGAKAAMFSLAWTAGTLELFGGPLILLGLCTRVVAFILCGEMAIAYFHSHAPRGFWPIRNGGELAALYCFAFLYLFVAGGGPVSLDRILRKRG